MQPERHEDHDRLPGEGRRGVLGATYIACGVLGVISLIAAGAFNNGAICGELGSGDLSCSPGGAVIAWGLLACIPGMAWLLTRMKDHDGFYGLAIATWFGTLFITGTLVVLMPKA